MFKQIKTSKISAVVQVQLEFLQMSSKVKIDMQIQKVGKARQYVICGQYQERGVHKMTTQINCCIIWKGIYLRVNNKSHWFIKWSVHRLKMKCAHGQLMCAHALLKYACSLLVYSCSVYACINHRNHSWNVLLLGKA